MKRFLKIFLPIILSIAILAGIGWYLFFYDPLLTQDVLLSGARYASELGNAKLSSWLYDRAYDQSYNMEEISIEIANQYVAKGNYTKAEVALNRAIKDGAGAPVYICLSKIFIEQDKILDAMELLDRISDPALKQELDGLRPEAPTTDYKPDLYNQYITVTISSSAQKLYVNTNGQYPSTKQDAYTNPITLQDGENVLYAVSVSDAGLPSSLSVFSYTIGGIIQAVEFQDVMMEAEIRNALKVTDSRDINTNELWSIETFTIPEHAKNYSDLQHMIHLKSLVIDNGVSGQLSALKSLKEMQSLTITNTNLTAEDMDAISALTSLTELKLDNCGISTIVPLSKLTALTKLSLNNNAIRNVSAISNLLALEELHLQRNVLVDISPIASCSFLTTLNIAHNTVVTITPLEDLELLKHLDISHNQIADISVLQNFIDLNTLHCSNNKITDITAISNCTKLSVVDISHNSISDLEATKNLMHVTHLNFAYNQVSVLPSWSKDNSFVTVDGSYNQISDLSAFSGHEHINNILMDYNENIESIDVLANCHVLIQVNVYGTNVKQVSSLTSMNVIVNYDPT